MFMLRKTFNGMWFGLDLRGVDVNRTKNWIVSIDGDGYSEWNIDN